MQDPVLAVVWYVVFLLSVTLHEAGHAWAALRGGDPTAYLGGQVSISPLPHIRREPFGMVLLPLVSVFWIGWPFGFASTPYDPGWAEAHPRRAAWMSLAGPAANALLALLSGLAIRAGLAAGWFDRPFDVTFDSLVAPAAPGLAEGAALVASVMFSLNLLLLVLNLLPLPPLDGAGALPLLLGRAAAERWLLLVRQPMVGWIGLLVAWNLFGHLFRPIFRVALRILYA